jgi:cell division ATPase FtsA
MLNLPFIQKAQKNPDKFLTLDINAGEVKCLAFYHENNTFKIIGNGRFELDPGCVRGGIIIEKDEVEGAIRSAVDYATQDLEEISDVIIGVNSNLCVSLVTTIRSKRNNTAPVHQKEIDELYERISQNALIQAQNEYLQLTGDPETELVAITTSNVYMKSDGMKVDELVGKETGIIELSVFNAFAPAFYMKAIQNIAKKSGLNIAAIGSELYALVQSVTQIYKEVSDFVVLDIAHDYTNAAIVFSGGVVSTKSLNIGYDHFIEGISDRMGITSPQATKILKTYLSGGLSQSESFVVRGCIKEIVDIWLVGLELLFGEFYGVKTFPSRIYITGIGADIKEILEAIQEEPWTKSIAFKSPPAFHKLSFSDLKGIADSTGKANKSEWITTASLAIIYEEIYRDD